MPRRFIRHPAAIPIKLCSQEQTNNENVTEVTTQDVSAGGLSCETENLMTPGDAVEVEISLEKPPFKTIGHVVWCKKKGNGFLVGIGFSDLATAYAVRMVEQVCYIEEYRQKILEEEGRELNSEEAAIEWISEHAHDFPQNVH
ncbi:PilZ domain-containing protein [Neptuniibacter sp. QD29_5]|uniref:PilZ domain-containing protein n=1 Tax=unclassified Neptuniibacter TaxID=2630693 RepID=UPI0039F72E7E